MHDTSGRNVRFHFPQRRRDREPGAERFPDYFRIAYHPEVIPSNLDSEWITSQESAFFVKVPAQGEFSTVRSQRSCNLLNRHIAVLPGNLLA
jgi:hypothetical protein